ncbi:MAG: caspase family protein [Caldilineaceae bacterium]
MSHLFDQGYALVVGVGQDLPTTVDDATALAALLRDPTRCAYPPKQVRLLTADAAHHQAVLDGLDWLATTASSNATALVYFSGHGMETPDYSALFFDMTL